MSGESGQTERGTEETTSPVEANQPTRLDWRGTALGFVLRLLGRTWRVSSAGPDPRQTRPGRAQLAALWHSDLLPIAFHFRDRGYSVAVSRSRDGDLITSVLLRLGYAPPPRGSSSRGGAAALRGLIRLLEDGTTVSVLVDGPRGPVGKVKPGIVTLGRLSGIPITPVAFAARPAVRLDSWDGGLIPLPFARVVCVFGEGIAIPPGASDEEDEARCVQRVEEALVLAADEAARLCGAKPRPAMGP